MVLIWYTFLYIIVKQVRGDIRLYADLFFSRKYQDELSCIFVEAQNIIPEYMHGDILDLSFTICDKRNSKTHIIFKGSYIFPFGST